MADTHRMAGSRLSACCTSQEQAVFPKYGVVPQMPLTDVSPPVNLLDNTTYFQRRVGNDTAKMGYFKTQLENEVTIELSAARHSGIMQYELPASGEKHVLVDISHYLPDENGGNSVQGYLGGGIHINESGRQYTGLGHGEEDGIVAHRLRYTFVPTSIRHRTKRGLFMAGTLILWQDIIPIVTSHISSLFLGTTVRLLDHLLIVSERSSPGPSPHLPLSNHGLAYRSYPSGKPADSETTKFQPGH